MPWVPLRLPTKEEIRAINQESGRKLRLLVDESTGVNVAESLKLWGYNAKYVAEIGLEGRSDEDVFAFAWKEERVIVTHDTDFLDDRRLPPHRNAGILLVRPGSNGRDNDGLRDCLIRALQIAGDRSEWVIGRKFDFSSVDTLTISTGTSRRRYRFTATDVMLWDDE